MTLPPEQTVAVDRATSFKATAGPGQEILATLSFKIGELEFNKPMNGGKPFPPDAHPFYMVTENGHLIWVEVIF